MPPKTALHPIARRWHRAAAQERVLRVERDEAIRAEVAAGRGIRETARRFGIDPSHVSVIARGK